MKPIFALDIKFVYYANLYISENNIYKNVEPARTIPGAILLDSECQLQCWTNLEHNICNASFLRCRTCDREYLSLHVFKLNINKLPHDYHCAICVLCIGPIRKQYEAKYWQILYKSWTLAQIFEINDIGGHIRLILYDILQL